MLARPKNPVGIETDGRLLDLILKDDDFKADYRNLKEAVRKLGFNIPPLVNSYLNVSPTMRMLGTGINDEFFDAYDTGILICYDEMYADKRDRHKEPYFRHLAEKMRIRFPNMRQEAEELAGKLTSVRDSKRVQQLQKFLTRQKEQVAEAEKKLRKSLKRKKKKEKVEP